MKILVTGANGFLGTSMVPLLAADHDVTALWTHREPRPVNRVSWRRFDLAVDSPRQNLEDSVDVLIHLAQSARYRDFPSGADDMFDVNVGGMHRLLEYARSAGARQFIFASTGSVYAAQHEPVSEMEAPRPSNYYGATKLAAESLAGAYASEFGVCVLRLFYPYGPGQTERMMSTLIERVFNGQPLMLQGPDGAQVCPTLAADIARVFSNAAEQRWEGLYNVASPEITTIRSLGERIGSLLKIDPLFETTEDTAPVPLLPDLGNFSSVFDLNEFTSLDSGLAETVAARSNDPK